MVVAQCPLLNDLNALSNFFYRSSLSAFLLWRLKQIEYSTWDRWISFGLFFIRTILNILAISIFRYPSTLAGGIEISCKIVNEKSTFFQLGFICLDFIIDIFVTIRLVQILNDGNRNSAEVTSIIGRDNSPSRRTSLFTAVLYWNFLLIEGRNLNEFNQNELDWLNRDGNGIIGNNNNNLPTTVISIPSSRNQVSSRSVSSIYNRILQRTTSSNNINNISNRPPSYQLDKGKFVVVSMQRLTFFEWANMVTEIPDVPPLPIQLQDQRQFNQPHRQFTQPQRQHTNQYHQRQISQDDSEALLPSLAYIPQSRQNTFVFYLIVYFLP
ncbi:18068_t:CDS:2 [Rhizophagus irregularis]|nr:18068_t:CDS:2 [Rhizophagus irregularis]